MLATTFYLGSSISDMNFYFDPSMPFLPVSQVDFFFYTVTSSKSLFPYFIPLLLFFCIYFIATGIFVSVLNDK